MTSLILFEDALKRISEAARVQSTSFLLKTELVSLHEALGRLTSEPVYARESVPQFNNSSMDGFVVRSVESSEASDTCPLTFDVRGCILAGDAPILDPSAAPMSSYEIMTGAPIPQGYDAVYKIEDVDLERNTLGKVIAFRVRESVESFENYRQQGSDFELGGKILESGTLLMPEQIMALASVGVSQLRVLRKPKVAVLATGSELSEVSDSPLIPGKIRNSTSSYLQSALPFLGVDVNYYGIVADEKVAFTQALQNILYGGSSPRGDSNSSPDIIITTGAVSKGSHDFIPEVIESIGAEIVFHNTAIRPGKPQLFGKFHKEGTAIFGIPGNPISTAVGFRFFVNAYVRGLLGRSPERKIRALLSEKVEKPRGMRCFFKARLELDSSGARVTSLPGQQSFIINSLLQANAWVVLEEGLAEVPSGSIVDVYPLYPFLYEYAETEPLLLDQSGETLVSHPANAKTSHTMTDSNTENCC